MIESPFSKQQLANAEKVVITKIEETSNSIFFHCVYIDTKGRHFHIVRWIKGIRDFRLALDCSCTSCSNFEVYHGKWCIFKIACAKELVNMGRWKPYILKFIHGDFYEN